MAAESWEIAVRGVSLSNPESRVDFFAGLPVSVSWSRGVCVCAAVTAGVRDSDLFGMAVTIPWARTLPVSVTVSR